MPEPAQSKAVSRYDGPRTTNELREYAQLLAVNTTPDGRSWRNEALPATFRGNPASVAFAVEYAKALDVSPVTALIGIHIVDGKPTASAGLISALVRRAGHRIRTWTEGSIEDGTFKATTTITREDDPEFEYKSEWGLDRAIRAGLMKRTPDGRVVAAKDRSAWATYPENMCKARTITECARDAAEDAILGVHYTPEELGAEVDENGEVVYTVTQVDNPPTYSPPVGGTTTEASPSAAADTSTPDAPTEEDGVDLDAMAAEIRTEILNASTAADLEAVWRDRRMTVAAASCLATADENGEPATIMDLFTTIGNRLREAPGDDDGGTPAQTPDTTPDTPAAPAEDDVVDAVIVEEQDPGTNAHAATVDEATARAQLDAVMSDLTREQVAEVIAYCRENGLNPANGVPDTLAIVRAIAAGDAFTALDEDEAVALVQRVLGGKVIEEILATSPVERHRLMLANRRAAAVAEDRDDRERQYHPDIVGGREAFAAARAANRKES